MADASDQDAAVAQGLVSPDPGGSLESGRDGRELRCRTRLDGVGADAQQACTGSVDADRRPRSVCSVDAVFFNNVNLVLLIAETLPSR